MINLNSFKHLIYESQNILENPRENEFRHFAIYCVGGSVLLEWDYAGVGLQTRPLPVGVSPKGRNVNSFLAADRYSAGKLKSNLGFVSETETLPVLFFACFFLLPLYENLHPRVYHTDEIPQYQAKIKVTAAGIMREKWRENYGIRNLSDSLRFRICWIPRIVSKRFVHLEDSVVYFIESL